MDLTLPEPTPAQSEVGRALHDVGLAALFGGNLFARVAMHPAVARVSSPTERGQVVNSSWRRYGTVNSLSLLAVVTGWAGARAGEALPSNLTGREQRLAIAKDALVAATAVTGIATAIAGVRFSAQTDGGDVALEDGSHAAADAPPAEARAKRILNRLGSASLACTGALIVVNAALAQENFRRPALRRALPGG